MSSETEVSVTVVGGNEHAPKIDREDSAADNLVAVPAGLGSETTVHTLMASDLDSEVLRFGISGGNASEYFSVNPATGKLFTARSLSNLQPASTLSLEVSVWDGGIPNRTDSIEISFMVTADNLHAPEFQSPATRIFIREDEQVSGTSLLTLNLDCLLNLDHLGGEPMCCKEVTV